MSDKLFKAAAARYIAIADALEQGADVHTPDVRYSVHDFSVDTGRIRFKAKRATSRGLKTDRIAVEIRRPSATDRSYSNTDIDIFAVVEPISRRVAYLHMSEIQYARQQTLFLTRDHSRLGMAGDYTPLYFDDLTDINRAVRVAKEYKAQAAV